MFGLEYILKTYNMSNSDLAKKMGINRANISMWIKSGSVPTGRLDELSKVFPHIPKEFFGKSLLKSEQLSIQEIYLTETDEWDEVEISHYDEEDQKEYMVKHSFSQNQGLIELVRKEQEEQEMLERFWKLYEDGYDFHRNEKMIDKFFSILETNDERQIDFLRMVFYYLRNEKQWGFDPFFVASTEKIEKAKRLQALMKEDWLND